MGWVRGVYKGSFTCIRGRHAAKIMVSMYSMRKMLAGEGERGEREKRRE